MEYSDRQVLEDECLPLTCDKTDSLLAGQYDLQDKYTVDQALEIAGSEGRYQKFLLVYFFLSWMVNAQLQLSSSYFFLPPKFQCFRPDGQMYQCEEKDAQACQNRLLFPGQSNSLAIQFGLYCDREYLRTIGQSLPPFGNFIILLITSSVQLPRIKCFIISNIISTILLVCLVFSPNIILAYTFFLTSTSMQFFCCNLQYVIINEQMSNRYRQFGCPFVFLGWGIAEMLLAVQSYYIQDWTQIIIFFSLIPQIILSYPLTWLIESPRYLHLQSNTQSFKSLTKIAKFNRNKFNITTDQIQPYLRDSNQKRYFVTDLIKYYSLRKQFIPQILCLLTIGLSYYGGVVATSNVGLSLEINLLLFGFSESVSYIIGALIVGKLHRKRTCIIIVFLIISLQISIVFFDIPADCIDFCEQKLAQTILASLSRFFITLFMCFFYVYITESYPTSVCNIGYGISRCIGILGNFSASYIDAFSENQLKLNPLILNGLFLLICFFSLFFIKETFNAQQGHDVKEECQRRKSSLTDQNNHIQTCNHNQ